MVGGLGWAGLALAALVLAPLLPWRVAEGRSSAVSVCCTRLATHNPTPHLTLTPSRPTYRRPQGGRDTKYGPACDLWSMGVILFILLGGYPPFYDESEPRLFDKIRCVRLNKQVERRVVGCNAGRTVHPAGQLPLLQYKSSRGCLTGSGGWVAAGGAVTPGDAVVVLHQPPLVSSCPSV